MCSDYVIEKAECDRYCQGLREKGTKVRDLPPKPKRRLQKDVFNKVREKWAKGLEMDEDRMEVDEDGAASDFGDDCLVEVSPFHEGGDEVCSDLDLGGEGSGDDEDEDDEDDEDMMDVDES